MYHHVGNLVFFCRLVRASNTSNKSAKLTSAITCTNKKEKAFYCYAHHHKCIIMHYATVMLTSALYSCNHLNVWRMITPLE